MGSPISPVFAEIFLQILESAIIIPRADIPFFRRYVDDCFGVVKKDQTLEILSALNSFHPEVQFTQEVEEDSFIAFLDILIMKQEDGSTGKEVYRKKTHTGRYLNFQSYHHFSQKIAVIDSLAHRGIKICDPEFLQDEFQTITKELVQNGYPKNLIRRRIFVMENRIRDPSPPEESKPRFILPYAGRLTNQCSSYLRKKLGCNFGYVPGHKIKSRLCNHKEKPPPMQMGVYMISCHSCSVPYYGESGRFQTRKKEHGRSIKNKNKDSAVAAHIKSHPDHIIDLDSASLIKKEPRTFNKKFLEALYIRKAKQTMNRDTGMDVNPIWSSLLIPILKHP